MPTINETIAPPGGYVFTDKDRVTFRASKRGTLVKAVEIYRTRNGFPVGNPAQEVAEQMCKRYPTVCRPGNHKTRAVSTHPPDPPQANRSLVLQWMNRLRRVKQEVGELRLRDDAEARRRIAVCKGCPERVNLPGGCSVCSDAIKIIRANILGRSALDGNLGACRLLNCDLATAVHLDEPAVSNPALPAVCWRKVGV